MGKLQGIKKYLKRGGIFFFKFKTMLHVRVRSVFLLDYPLIFFLLKYNGVGIFLNHWNVYSNILVIGYFCKNVCSS